MIIRCWGSRGSIPVSGAQYTKYGGDTTCIEVTGDSGELIIIDAGTGIRALGNQLAHRRKLTINLLLTHAHWDHLSGFPFFRPIYKKDTVIKVYGNQNTRHSLKKILSKAMTSPYFPVELEEINADISFHGMGNKGYSIGDIKVETIPLSHPNEGAGYRLTGKNGRSFVFLTDNELTYHHATSRTYKEYIEFARDADVMFHDAEYDRKQYRKTRGWGHSVYLDTLEFALKAGVKTLGLFHHNQDRADWEIDAIERNCKSILSKNGSRMRCFAVAAGTEIHL